MSTVWGMLGVVPKVASHPPNQYTGGMTSTYTATEVYDLVAALFRMAGTDPRVATLQLKLLGTQATRPRPLTDTELRWVAEATGAAR